MALIHLTKDDYTVSQWAGGTTTQIAIAPEDAVYGQRDFLWRISSASVDLEESDFTALPDYHRWIATLVGEMTLSHNGSEPIRLAPYDVHQFDGGAETHSWGRCTDFNLMLRKGTADGLIRSAHIRAGAAHVIAAEGKADGRTVDLLLFCGKGTATVVLGDQVVFLSAFEAVLLKDAAAHSLKIATDTSAAFMIAEIWH